MNSDDFGFAFRSGHGKAPQYWYRNASTGKFYEGPAPKPAVLRANPSQGAAPATTEIEPCPWSNVRSPNHELIAIPGPPEVLYNKRGLTNADEIYQLEALGAMRAMRYLEERVTQTTPMTVAWLRKLHELAFGDLYTWAGKYRTVQLSKGGKHPFSAWCQAIHIDATMQELEAKYLRPLTPLAPRDADDVPRRVAILISEFLLIHPFREGNGRVAQLMGNWVALQAGLPTIAYGIDDDSDAKDAYIVALQRGYNQDYAALEQFVRAGLERSQKALRRLKLDPPLPG